MATLTPTLTLVSTDAFSHQPINISTTDSLSVTAPYTDLSRVAPVVTGGSGTIITAASGAPITYFYIKHSGKVAANNSDASISDTLIVQDAGGALIATLAPGEFMFFPSAAGEGVRLESTSTVVFAEYIYFSKA